MGLNSLAGVYQKVLNGIFIKNTVYFTYVRYKDINSEDIDLLLVSE